MKISRLYPEFKDYIWGGEKLKKKYGKSSDKLPCAESWELSFHKDGLTRIFDGRTLSESVTIRDLGKNVEDFSTFPVLVKLIDAKENLSMQVHPDDEYALRYENSYGKSEMWYIIEAESGAGIYLGFKRDVTKEEYVDAIKEKRLTELLNFYEVKAGECYYIPPGTIHAIGRGCVICEIQQNSNITYRVYDYGRKDKLGNLRELHIEKALATTSLKKYELNEISGGFLCVSKYFTARKILVSDGELQMLADEKSFQYIICISGEGKVGSLDAKPGDSFFVPADYGTYTLMGDMEIILAEVRKYRIKISASGSRVATTLSDDAGRIVAEIIREIKDENISAEFTAELCRDLLCAVNMSASDISEIKIDGREAAYLKSEHIMHILSKKLA